MKTFRIGQLNLNHRDQEKRFPLIAEAVAHNKLDFLAVQELIAPEALMHALLPYGYIYSEFTEYRSHGNAKEYVGIISRKSLHSSNVTTLAADAGITFISSTIGIHPINLISTHFPWGSQAEPARLEQAELIDSLAADSLKENPEALTVLAGDLNAEPDYRSIRYLSGKELSADGRFSTLWTDAWVTAGVKENEFTSKHSSNSQGRATAFGVGITYPGFIPDRRIDYIFTRGWNYGREGCPVSFAYLTHPNSLELSDHEGIYADILIEG